MLLLTYENVIEVLSIFGDKTRALIGRRIFGRRRRRGEIGQRLVKLPEVCVVEFEVVVVRREAPGVTHFGYGYLGCIFLKGR